MKNNKKMNNKGFSLVELIIVIAIMAILAVVLVPAFMRFVAQSRISNDISNADIINDAVTAMITEDAADQTTNFAAAPYANNKLQVSNAQGNPWVIDDPTNNQNANADIITAIGGEPILPSVDSQNNRFYVYADENGDVTVLASDVAPTATVNNGVVTFAGGTILSPYDAANIPAGSDWEK